MQHTCQIVTVRVGEFRFLAALWANAVPRSSAPRAAGREWRAGSGELRSRISLAGRARRPPARPAPEVAAGCATSPADTCPCAAGGPATMRRSWRCRPRRGSGSPAHRRVPAGIVTASVGWPWCAASIRISLSKVKRRLRTRAPERDRHHRARIDAKARLRVGDRVPRGPRDPEAGEAVAAVARRRECDRSCSREPITRCPGRRRQTASSLRASRGSCWPSPSRSRRTPRRERAHARNAVRRLAALPWLHGGAATSAPARRAAPRSHRSSRRRPPRPAGRARVRLRPGRGSSAPRCRRG